MQINRISTTPQRAQRQQNQPNFKSKISVTTPAGFASQMLRNAFVESNIKFEEKDLEQGKRLFTANLPDGVKNKWTGWLDEFREDGMTYKI